MYDDAWDDQWDPFEDPDPVPEISIHGSHIWIDGIQITAWDCPICLRREIVRCTGCSFFAAESCYLRRDTELRCDLKAMLDDQRDRTLRSRKQQMRLALVLRSELLAHGRPLHYSVLTQMVTQRYPTLKVNERRVLHTLSSATSLFESLGDGVYQVGDARR